jgi:hypothetical protein
MLPTGTLSLFAVAALRAVGGWPTQTITEDAEIGVRLQAAGCRGLWLARPVGRGLLPVDLSGIRQQRARWSSGNFQVLKGLLAISGQRPTPRDLLYLVAQLTAWITFILPAAIALAVAPFLPQLPGRGLIASLAAATILCSGLLTACRMILINDNQGALIVRLEAVIAKLALTWTSATAWLAALFPRPLQFQRTPKAMATQTSADTAILGVSAVFLALSLHYAAAAQLGPALACLLLAAVWPCGRFVDQSLRLAAAHDPERC